MSTIAKEWLQQKIADMEAIRDDIPFGLGEDGTNTLAALRIALASLEAEPVCVIDQSNLDYLKSGSDADVWPASRKEMGDVLLYRTAPPAPANAEPVAWLWSHRKHPSEVSLVRPEDDERAEGAHWSGWSCQALYAVPPAQVSEPDRSMFEKWWESEHGSPLDSWDSLRTTDGYCDDGIDGQFEAWNACRAAILQRAEPVQGWIPCSDRMPTKNHRVLIFINFNSDTVPPSIHDAQFTGSTFRRGNATVNVFPLEDGYGVTHWMPLPAAPQQGA